MQSLASFRQETRQAPPAATTSSEELPVAQRLQRQGSPWSSPRRSALEVHPARAGLRHGAVHPPASLARTTTGTLYAIRGRSHPHISHPMATMGPEGGQYFPWRKKNWVHPGCKKHPVHTLDPPGCCKRAASAALRGSPERRRVAGVSPRHACPLSITPNGCSGHDRRALVATPAPARVRRDAPRRTRFRRRLLLAIELCCCCHTRCTPWLTGLRAAAHTARHHGVPSPMSCSGTNAPRWSNITLALCILLYAYQ